MKINFNYRFHPVGQGLFASGSLHAEIDQDAHIAYSWVFDCGSMSPKTDLQPEVVNFRRYGLKNQNALDLLCISHFDCDHVNGLTDLLKDTDVDTVVIPYYTPLQRLVIGCMQEGRAASSPDYHRFIHDPISFILNSAQRVRRIILIFPGTSPNEAQSPFTPPLSDYPIDLTDNFDPLSKEVMQDERRPWLFRVANPDDRVPPDGSLPSLTKSLKDSGVELVAMQERCILSSAQFGMERWEFLFHHKPQSITISDYIVNEMDRIFHLPSSTGDGRSIVDCLQVRELRNRIRDVYRKANPDSKRFNTNGLSTYAGPVEAEITMISDKLLWSGIPPSIVPTNLTCRNIYYPFRPPNKASILYTGDTDLAPPENRDELIEFLTLERFKKVLVLQVPHHGSRNNWQIGSASSFPHLWSVISAKPTYKHGHPHTEVVTDLLEHNPVLVNLKSGVSWLGTCQFS